MVSQGTLDEIVKRLVTKFEPTKIILFGSQARGTADDKSDVDLLVICPLAKNRRELWLEMDRSLIGLKLARDIIILTPEEYEVDRHIPGTIARPASMEGKILYDKSRI